MSLRPSLYTGRPSSQCHRAMALVFFCPVPKVGAHFGRLITKRLKSPKWHWLILSQMGALACIPMQEGLYPKIYHWTLDNLNLTLNNFFEDKSTKYLNWGNCKQANKVCIRGSQGWLVGHRVSDVCLPLLTLIKSSVVCLFI